jgi:hypothetical protein
MKKQNVNNKLAFNKAAVTELNNKKLLQINGGTNTVNGIQNTLPIEDPNTGCTLITRYQAVEM